MTTWLLRGAAAATLITLGLFCAGVRPPSAAAHTATGAIDCAGVSAQFYNFETAEVGHVEASDNGAFFLNGPVSIAAGASSQSWPHAFTPGTHTVQLVITWPSSHGNDYNSHPVSLTCSSGTTTTQTTTTATTTVVSTVATTTTVPVTNSVTTTVTSPPVTTIVPAPQPPTETVTVAGPSVEVTVPGASTTMTVTTPAVTLPAVTVKSPPVTKWRTKTVTRTKWRTRTRTVPGKVRTRVVTKVVRVPGHVRTVISKPRVVTRTVHVRVPGETKTVTRYVIKWRTRVVTRDRWHTKTIRVRVPYTVCPKGTHKVPGTHACGVEGQG